MRWLLVFIIFTTYTSAAEVTFSTFNTYWLYDDKNPHKKWWLENRGAKGQTVPQAIQAVALAIKNLNADVVALQEVEGKEMVSTLVTKLEELGVLYPYVWTGNGSDSYTGQDVALLSRYPSIQEPTLSFSHEREGYLTEVDAGNEASTGISKGLNITLNINDNPVDIFVFHLKSQSGGFKSDSQRIAQASIIRRLTLPLIHEGRNFLVMGDLNADKGSPTLRRIRGLDDIYVDLFQTSSSEDFVGNRWTYSYKGRPQQLDHILLSPTLRKAFKSGKVEYNRGNQASDHYGVVVNLSL